MREPNQALHSDRGRILVSRDTTALQRPRRVNCVVSPQDMPIMIYSTSEPETKRRLSAAIAGLAILGAAQHLYLRFRPWLNGVIPLAMKPCSLQLPCFHVRVRDLDPGRVLPPLQGRFHPQPLLRR